MKTHMGSLLFSILNYTLLAVLAVVALYPFWDVIVSSFISIEEYYRYPVHLFPRKITFAAYAGIMKLSALWQSYFVTIRVTLLGTAVSLLLTVPTGYALSKRIKGQSFFMFMIVFTLLFQGGIVPTYMVVRSLGIMDTLWALVLPAAIQTWNLIIMRNYFSGVPSSLEESAKIDGANDIVILLRIVLPISKAILATIALFYAVYYWNDFLNAIFYISSKAKWPLQLFLRGLLFEAEDASYGSSVNDLADLGITIKMAAVGLAAIPIISVYPFFQKYFVKGALLGSVKG